MSKDTSKSSGEMEIIEKNLDLSGGEPAAEVFIEVPPDKSGATAYYKYTIAVSKQKMTDSLLKQNFDQFWQEVESAALEDLNKV